jgi:subtilisin family serine protease
MSTLRSRALYLLVAVVALLWGILGVGPRTAGIAGNGGIASTARAPELVGVKRQALLEKADSDGGARLIVTLDVPIRSEGALDPWGVTLQRAAIEQAQARLVDALEGLGIRASLRFDSVPVMVLELSPDAVERLLGLSGVLQVRVDDLLPTNLEETIPLVGGTTAYSLGYGGEGASVAVLDTGVDQEHPFLQGKVVMEACYSTTSSYDGAQTLCPNGRESQVGAGAAEPCDAVGCEHGTHVAGIIAGWSESLQGVAPGASLLPVQIFSSFTGETCSSMGMASPCILTYRSDVIRALEWLLEVEGEAALAAVNLSLGVGSFTSACDTSEPELKSIIDHLQSKGVAVIAAAGNDGSSNALNMPACLSNVVSVGATDDRDQVANFSNSASFLDLLAPGVQVKSSIPGGGYEAMGGTSMAAPHISGAWAVLAAISSQAEPGVVLETLKTTGILVEDGRNGMSYPRLQLDAAADWLVDHAGPTLTSTLGPTPTALPQTGTPTTTVLPTATPIPTATPRPWTFEDVPPDHPYFEEVESLYQAGYVQGCSESPLRYCPDRGMNRAESAVFVERGVHGSDHVPAQPTVPVFADVALEAWYAEWATAMWEEGYTSGCATDPPLYCPERSHTRAEASVFYLRMMYGLAYEPPGARGLFADVDPQAWYARWVEAGWEAGIVKACAGEPELRFCPLDPLTRGEAAQMMARAKGLVEAQGARSGPQREP